MSDSKLLPGFGLVIFLVLIGFVIGLFVGGLAVPKDGGLAGGAIVFGYGVIGAFVALVLALVLSIKLPRPVLVRTVWVAMAGVLLAALALFFRYRSVQEERAVRQEEQRVVAPEADPPMQPAEP